MRRGVSVNDIPSWSGEMVGPLPVGPSATSGGVGGVGIEASRFRDLPGTERVHPPTTHRRIVLEEGEVPLARVAPASASRTRASPRDTSSGSSA